MPGPGSAVSRRSADINDPFFSGESDARADLERDLRKSSGIRVMRNTSRMKTGDTPYHLLAVGPHRMLSQATGEIAVGGSESVYLTTDGQATGEAVYTRRPRVEVLCDANANVGGLNRADGPDGPENSLKLKPHSSFEVEWDVPGKVWKVTVTNDTESPTGFMVDSTGVE